MSRLIALGYSDRTSEIFGLLDTGSSLNVLPYDVGMELGAVCEEHRSQLAFDICPKLKKSM